MSEIRPNIPAETRGCEEWLLMNGTANGPITRRSWVQILPPATKNLQLVGYAGELFCCFPTMSRLFSDFILGMPVTGAAAIDAGMKCGSRH